MPKHENYSLLKLEAGLPGQPSSLIEASTIDIATQDNILEPLHPETTLDRVCKGLETGYDYVTFYCMRSVSV
jgi:hypothetical protein